MNRYLRIPMLMAVDAVLILAALTLAYFARFQDVAISAQYWDAYVDLVLLYVIVFPAVFYALRMYHRIWEYASLKELVVILQGVTVGTLVVILLTMFIELRYPRSIPLITWAFVIILVGGSRFAWRLFRERAVLAQKTNGCSHPVNNANVLIVGAGSGGALVAKELSQNRVGMRPVGFVDDDPRKKKMQLLGLPVLGTRDDIPQIVKLHNVKELIIAMPSMPGETIREIMDICCDTGVHTKILPGVYQLISGEVSVNQIRPVQVEDILRREPVRVDLQEIARYLSGKKILVTGAGGSIGSELCRQIVAFNPIAIVLLDNYENTTNDVFLELKYGHPKLDIRIEIADIRDRVRMESIFQSYRPEVVFHAAAHKHVPLMEYSPSEAVRTNIFGTRNVAEAALSVDAGTFILISTDKAVNPTSVMGATKRLAEVIIQQLNGRGATCFAAVRFGNVLESNGSVVPLFKRQIAAGGPVTVTHPDMTRYFMTIPEAVQLVIQAGAMAEGGEVFVLDMGDPVKILDLASDLIRLSGFETGKEIEIEFIGVRPGEKLFEELLTAEEGTSATRHRRIFTARPTLVNTVNLERQLARLKEKGAFCTGQEVFQALSRVVPAATQARGSYPDPRFIAQKDVIRRTPR
ncbi:MAG: nucleoside-diphosphate sugar epimerase/dehydratase [Clostridia bacterium]|nr:nucleoside-diphosphate sugar epimerase/dehydratase [Clostridia bacterium]